MKGRFKGWGSVSEEAYMATIIKDIFVPATISNVYRVFPGEITEIALTLPREVEIEGKVFPVRDLMRPGTAFLAKPWGLRTGKFRRRMYTRSNCSWQSNGVLETFINDTHREKADTSPWWQTHELEALCHAGGTVDVRLDFDPVLSEFTVYENARDIHQTNLRLEPDVDLVGCQMVAIGLSTGITPFLSYVRYLEAREFRPGSASSGIHLTLVVSVAHHQCLMAHEELLEYAKHYPDNFRYHPVLTRDWPQNWPFSTGRFMRKVEKAGEARIDIGPLLAIAPNLQNSHVRFCGNAEARDQLHQGLQHNTITPLSFRAEVW
jgi:hypothetical protein